MRKLSTVIITAITEESAKVGFLATTQGIRGNGEACRRRPPVIHKIYCTDPNCVWRTDRVCAWTSCPKNKRLSFKGDIEQYKEFLKTNKPPEPAAEVPVVVKPYKPRKHGGGRPPKPVIGTDARGIQHPFPSCAAADDAFGLSSGTVSSAILTHHKGSGIVWRWA